MKMVNAVVLLTLVLSLVLVMVTPPPDGGGSDVGAHERDLVRQRLRVIERSLGQAPERHDHVRIGHPHRARPHARIAGELGERLA